MPSLQIEPFSLAAFAETATALGRAFERDTFLPSLLPPDRRPARPRALSRPSCAACWAHPTPSTWRVTRADVCWVRPSG